MVKEWIRLNRVTRDIPANLMINIDKILENVGAFSNMRQMVQQKGHERGMPCKCIRCKEVRGKTTDLSKAQCTIREYDSSDGREFFISFESPDNEIIYGFLRLRLSETAGEAMRRGKKKISDVIFPELIGSALIRELHVYGCVVEVNNNRDKNVQHYGFGSRMMEVAEMIAVKHGFRRMSVISGVGVRDYYRRKGFRDGPYFLNKDLELAHPTLLPISDLYSKYNQLSDLTHKVESMHIQMIQQSHEIDILNKSIRWMIFFYMILMIVTIFR